MTTHELLKRAGVEPAATCKSQFKLVDVQAHLPPRFSDRICQHHMYEDENWVHVPNVIVEDIV